MTSDKPANSAWLLRGPRRKECLQAISRTEGEDLDWVASQAGMSLSALRRHIRELKTRGYVYTAHFNHTEVWLTKKGWSAVKEIPETPEAL